MGFRVLGLVVGLPLLQLCLTTKAVVCFSIMDSCVQQLLLGLLALSFWHTFTLAEGVDNHHIHGQDGCAHRNSM